MTSFEAASVSLLADGRAPPLRNEAARLYSRVQVQRACRCRCWPDEAPSPAPGHLPRTCSRKSSAGPSSIPLKRRLP